MNPADLEQAACKKMHPGVFFPTTEEGVAVARAVCYRCPVREECLREAIRLREDHGIYGGHTANERRRMYRVPKAPDPPKNSRQVKDCPTCNRALDRGEFALDRARADGLSGECKACRHDRERRRREARKKAS